MKNDFNTEQIVLPMYSTQRINLMVKRNHLPQLFFRIVKVKVWDSQIGPTLSDFRCKKLFKIPVSDLQVILSDFWRFVFKPFAGSSCELSDTF